MTTELEEQYPLFEPDVLAELKAKKKTRKPWLDYTPKSAEKIIQVLSYGGGVQTFAMLVAIEQGYLPKPDLIVFADPGREDSETYRHIEEVAKPLVAKLGITYHEVKRGIKGDGRDIYQYHWDKQLTPIWPTCTMEFKIRPIQRLLTSLYKIVPGVHTFDSWIGITTDESQRTTPSGVAYIRKVFPFLDLGWNRERCIYETLKAGYRVPPKSGCDICCHKDWEYLYTAANNWFQSALALEEHAAIERPRTSLPQYGRNLRSIALQPRFNVKEFQDSCGTGYCHV